MAGIKPVSPDTASGSGPEKPETPIRLLLVDDEKVFVDTLANRLKRRGFVVSKAYSGSDAIQLLRKHEYEVAIVDLKMEDMDGLEVLKIFRKMDPQLKVIMLTGHGSESASRQGIEYGAFDYLSKPCEFEELLEKIMNAGQTGQPAA
ncbi:MAG: response regulator [Pseudomonadota bacterium]